MATIAQSLGAYFGYSAAGLTFDQGKWATIAPAGPLTFKYMNVAINAFQGVGVNTTDSLTRILANDFSSIAITPVIRVELATFATGNTPAQTCRQVAGTDTSGAGSNDANYTAHAQIIKTWCASAGVTPIFRLGWEMDGGWYPWSVCNTQGAQTASQNVPDYIAAYKHVHDLIVAQIPTAQFDLCGNMFYGGGPTHAFDQSHSHALWDQIYGPLVGYYQYRGADVYSSIPGADNAARQANLTGELDMFCALVAADGVPFSFPEWGVDNPLFANVLDPASFVTTIYNTCAAPPHGAVLGHQEIFDPFDPENNQNRGMQFVQKTAQNQPSGAGLIAAQTYKTLFTATNVIVNPPPGNLVREWIGIMPRGIVLNAPNAPTNVTAVAGNGQVSVSWTPGTDGGSAITGYTVTKIGDGGGTTPVTGTPPATGATITVTNGVAVTFTVHATNGIGDSSESAASNSATPSVGWYDVQTPAENAVTGLTVTAALVSARSAGKVIVAVSDRGNNFITRAVTSPGLTFTKRGECADASMDTGVQIWEMTAGTYSAGAVVTYTVSSSSDLCINVREIGGIGSFDKASTGVYSFQKNGSATPPTSASTGATGTLGSATSLVLAAAATNGNEPSAVFDNNMTVLDRSSTNRLTLGALTTTVTTTTTFHPTWFSVADNCSAVTCAWPLA